MDFSKLKLVTSNKNKLAEFNRLGLAIQIESGFDLKEVDSSAIDVAMYKALEAGENLLVEDTVLIVNGEEIVDIRSKIDQMDNFIIGSDASWQVLLSVQQGDYIYVSIGIVKGVIRKPKEFSEKAFGFDPYFYPTNNNPKDLSLYQMELNGIKDDNSARKKAIDSFLKKDFFAVFKVKDIVKWKGLYQNIKK